MNPVEQAAALAEFPDLQRLVDLRDAGWTFFPTILDARVVEVHAVRTWPGGWADALRVRSATDVAGLRTDHAGGITWQRDGTLVEVVYALLALPSPGDRLAPRLVTGRGPRLWTGYSRH